MISSHRAACLVIGTACALVHPAPGQCRGLGPDDFPSALGDARGMVSDPYARDCAGARLAFATDATNLALTVRYAPAAEMPAHNHFLSTGEWRVEGESAAEFSRPARTGGVQTVEIHLDGPRQMRTHEILLPLADRAGFCGLVVDANASACRTLPPASRTIVAYGDSITQGFFASRPSRAYPALLAQTTGWNVLNLGFCGRKTTPRDALAIAALKPDGVIVLMGENDALFATNLEVFRDRFRAFLSALARNCPSVSVWVGTPTPVSGKKYKAENLEDYRQAIRDAVAAAGPDFHILEGTELLPAHPKLLTDGLHPNDAGFEILAKNVKAALLGERPRHPREPATGASWCP